MRRPVGKEIGTKRVAALQMYLPVVPKWVGLAMVVMALLACAGLTEQVRLAKFESSFEAYDIAIRRSQFRTVVEYIDPAFRDETFDADSLSNIKVVNYSVTRFKVSEDRRSVEQMVRLEYYLLEQNILKTISYPQTWRFNEERDRWLLHTPLPTFGR